MTSFRAPPLDTFFARIHDPGCHMKKADPIIAHSPRKSTRFNLTRGREDLVAGARVSPYESSTSFFVHAGTEKANPTICARFPLGRGDRAGVFPPPSAPLASPRRSARVVEKGLHAHTWIVACRTRHHENRVGRGWLSCSPRSLRATVSGLNAGPTLQDSRGTPPRPATDSGIPTSEAAIGKAIHVQPGRESSGRCRATRAPANGA